MGERARVTNGGLPHRVAARRTIAITSAILAGTAMVEATRAEPPMVDLYDPTPTIDAGIPPTFSRDSPARTDAANRFQGVPSRRSAHPPGAGSTGFVSSAPRAGADDEDSAPPPDPSVDTPVGLALPAGGVDDVVVTPPRSRRRRPAVDDPYEPLGLRLGSFVVKPAIEMSGGYDSNPERTTQARGSGVLIVAPELQVRSDWSRHEFRADVLGRYTTYPGFDATPSPDRPFLDSKVAGRIDVTRRTRIGLEGRFLLSTENPNSPDLPAGLARLPMTMTGGFTAGVTQQFNRLELGVSGSFDRSVYGESILTDGTSVSNDDRNYNDYGVKLRGSYELVPGVKPFVEVGYDRRIYDLPVDAGGINRDSTGSEVRVGSAFELARRLTGSASVGYAERRYQDPALENLSGLIADGALTWTATPLTKLTFLARSSIDESAQANVSGVLRRDFSVQVEHAFRHWLIGTLRFGFGLSDYVGSPRVDQLHSLAGRLTYKLSREVQLKGEVRREWLTSNVPSADYTANIFLLGIRLQR